jgi:hypothetical protein
MFLPSQSRRWFIFPHFDLSEICRNMEVTRNGYDHGTSPSHDHVIHFILYPFSFILLRITITPPPLNA